MKTAKIVKSARKQLRTDVPRTSRIHGFYELPISERQKKVAKFASLSSREMSLLKKASSLRIEDAEDMVENVITTMPFPFCIAPNFLVNGREYLVPMVSVEPSVVAGAANAAKKTLNTSGFEVEAYERAIITTQVQLIEASNTSKIVDEILSHKSELIRLANKELRGMVARGGGAIDVSAKSFEKTRTGPMVVVNLEIDCKDAHGANVAIRTAESVAPYIEEITGTKTNLKIVSNFTDKRVVTAKAVFPKETIGGERIVDRVIHAQALAEVDIYRATTHNKGIMNGICSVALATANEIPALEAGAHAFASRNGHYEPLSDWVKDESGNLVGTLTIPIQVGTVGGLISVHPISRIALKILGNPDSRELASVMGAVGLASNAAALFSLSDQGIVHGHIKLHAKNIAKMAGATGREMPMVVKRMINEGGLTTTRAREIIQDIRR